MRQKPRPACLLAGLGPRPVASLRGGLGPGLPRLHRAVRTSNPDEMK